MPKAKIVKQPEGKKVFTTTDKDVNLIAGGLSTFFCNIQAFLAHDPNSKSKAPLENLVYSPFCLFSSLAALKLGTTANGKTSKELDKILHFPSDSSALRSGFKNIFPTLQSSQFPPEISLQMASRIFVSEGVQLKKEFVDTVEHTFGENVTISTLDFGSKEAAAKEINKWAAAATGNLVTNVVTKKTLETESSSEKNEKGSPLQILIVSAVYFKGFWSMDFPNFTPETFNPINGKSFEIQMMDRYIPYLHSARLENLEATVFAIPYKDNRLWLIYYFPNDQNGLSKIENGLKNSPNPPSNLFKILYNKRNTIPVNLHMPKFKIECTLDLTEPLKKTGLVKMFTPGSGFSSMTSSKENAEVVKVLQRVIFEVDEKGVETPVIKVREDPLTQHILWAVVDQTYMRHPFYFQLVDKRNDIVILAGTCMDPTKT